MSNFEIVKDENGTGDVLILKGKWSEEFSLYMKENHIYSLRLTDSFGFNGHDLSFLSNLTFLKGLEIYCWEAKGIKVIESLPQLEVIGLQYKSIQNVDLAAFSKLRVAKVTWSKGLSSLLGLPSLEKLNVQNYPHTNLCPISSMLALKRLYITSRKLESLHGIERLLNLELLDLYNCPSLNSLAGTEHCPKLKAIAIEACKRLPHNNSSHSAN